MTNGRPTSLTSMSHADKYGEAPPQQCMRVVFHKL